MSICIVKELLQWIYICKFCGRERSMNIIGASSALVELVAFIKFAENLIFVLFCKIQPIPVCRFGVWVFLIDASI